MLKIVRLKSEHLRTEFYIHFAGLAILVEMSSR